jgi:hypothetical protein
VSNFTKRCDLAIEIERLKSEMAPFVEAIAILENEGIWVPDEKTDMEVYRSWRETRSYLQDKRDKVLAEIGQLRSRVAQLEAEDMAGVH